MKSILNMMNFKKLFLLPLIVLALMVSCQTEETDITNPPQEEIIEANSQTAQLMSKTALNDGSTDNIVDYANCLEVVLPVTVTANGVTITIESYTDYDALEEILDAFTEDDDVVEISFPITVVLNNYTELVINNQAELEAQIELCNDENEDDDDIECIDFQYPLVFSIYNPNFQLLDTVNIENDEALYNFTSTIDGSVLVSLNYPVTLILNNGQTLVVNNNTELNVALSEAEGNCDEDDDYDWNDDDFECSEQDIELALKECIWNIVNYNGDDTFTELNIDFATDYTFTASQNGNIIHNGNWNVSTNESNVYTVSFSTNWQDVNGTWTVVECDEDRFKLVMNNNIMVIEQECNVNTPFDCFGSFNASIEKCDEGNDSFEVFNLTNVFANCITPNYSVTYHETQADAETSTNAIATPEAYTNTSVPQVIYVRVGVVNDPSAFEIFTIELILTDCGTSSGCSLQEVKDYLQTCVWNTVNLDGSNNLIIYDLEFLANNDIVITNTSNNATYSGYWNVTSTPSGDLELELANVNGPNIQAINGFWNLLECDTDRLQFTNDTNTVFVMEQDCTTSNGCNVDEVEMNLKDCEWTVTSYNNDTGFNIFNIDFQVNAAAVIFTPDSNEEYSANWTISLDGEIYLDLSNISGGNVQVLEGNYILVECTPTQLIFHDQANTSIELILDKDCN